ncbi:MAG: CBS domain-containing protein, partial [Chloroflexi bacterium]|nr:CBS domain-containing protein [Chloroflexota bacterium]
IWVVTGDGDGLSIGGNHLIHAIRRNIDINIILFNNRIYGLTKGQYSPTSRVGTRTKSSPMGSIEQPINPIALALAAESTFIARTLDAHTKHLEKTFHAAAQHKGISFIEVYQNCVIFNSDAWKGLDDRRMRDDNILYLEHGKPMVYGKNLDKGIRLNGFKPEIVALGNGISEDDLIVHDETSMELAFIISSMEQPDFPAPLGVIRRVKKPTYADGLMGQVQQAQAQNGVGDLKTLYHSVDTWTVTADDAVTSQLAGNVPLSLDDEYVDELDRDRTPKTVMQDRLTEDEISTLLPNVPITIDASASLAKAVRQMNAHKIGCLLVTDDEDKLIGVFTERDVLMRVVGVVDDLSESSVGEFMTPNPIALNASFPIAQALHEMSVHGFRHLPLVDSENRPDGIISFRDVVRYLKQSFG